MGIMPEMRADNPDGQGRTDRGLKTPPVLSVCPDNVDGQGGQSVRFLQNNAFSNANLALRERKFTSESSGLIVL